MTPAEKKTLLVTGGASGIGASVAARWLTSGGRVALLDISDDAVQSALERLGDDRVTGHVADVRDDTQVADVVGKVASEFGGSLDAVANCAGIAQPIVAAEGADEDWVRMVDIHLNGTMRVNRAAYPYLKASGRGAIVNISSIAGTLGLPGRTNYCAAKAGIEGLTRGLAVEWAPYVRVNAVAPGYVQTPMIDRLVADGKLNTQPIISRTPLSRFCDPDEIASVICFLASDLASFVTGQTIRADGGLTIDGNWYGAGS
ncbi:SDR family NAD(P)-dependent oxidoreductase [Rhodococcus sp. NPDC057529]|uniref:SDR family NAD(P)-dependent oxidoreductase n=1 Tax=Rhodococcus sp. NPDC057529 TaxID=3346158 RepID=UPI00367253F2